MQFSDLKIQVTQFFDKIATKLGILYLGLYGVLQKC